MPKLGDFLGGITALLSGFGQGLQQNRALQLQEDALQRQALASRGSFLPLSEEEQAQVRAQQGFAGRLFGSGLPSGIFQAGNQLSRFQAFPTLTPETLQAIFPGMPTESFAGVAGAPISPEKLLPLLQQAAESEQIQKAMAGPTSGTLALPPASLPAAPMSVAPSPLPNIQLNLPGVSPERQNALTARTMGFLRGVVSRKQLLSEASLALSPEDAAEFVQQVEALQQEQGLAVPSGEGALGTTTRRGAIPALEDRVQQLDVQIQKLSQIRGQEANRRLDNLRQERNSLVQRLDQIRGRFGVDREATASRLYGGRTYSELTPPQQAAVEKAVEERQVRISAAQGREAATTALQKAEDTMIPLQQADQVYDLQTLLPVPFGSTYKQAKALKAVVLPQLAVNRLTELENAHTFFEQIQGLAKKVWGPGGPLADVTNKNIASRGKGYVEALWQRASQADPNVRSLRGLLALYQTQMSRVMAGERGQTTESDVNRARIAIPNLEGFPDTREAAFALLAEAQKLLAGVRRTIIVRRGRTGGGGKGEEVDESTEILRQELQGGR